MRQDASCLYVLDKTQQAGLGSRLCYKWYIVHLCPVLCTCVFHVFFYWVSFTSVFFYYCIEVSCILHVYCVFCIWFFFSCSYCIPVCKNVYFIQCILLCIFFETRWKHLKGLKRICSSISIGVVPASIHPPDTTVLPRLWTPLHLTTCPQFLVCLRLPTRPHLLSRPIRPQSLDHPRLSSHPQLLTCPTHPRFLLYQLCTFTESPFPRGLAPRHVIRPDWCSSFRPTLILASQFSGW